MPTYSQIEPNDAWIQEVEEIEDALMDCEVVGTLVSELDVFDAWRGIINGEMFDD